MLRAHSRYGVGDAERLTKLFSERLVMNEEHASTDNQKTIRYYDALDRASKVSIPSKDGNVIVTTTFVRPSDPAEELKRLLALNDSIVRETEMTPQGEVAKYRDTPAYGAHFFDLSPTVEVKIVGKDEPPIKLSPSEVNDIAEETRAKFVAKLYQSKCTVLQNAGSTGYAFLFEPKGDEERSFTTVRQIIGDPDQPSFVLDHYVRRPGRERRESYDRQTRRTYTQRKGDMPRRKVVIDVRPGIELFESGFVYVTAPQYNGVQYGIKLGEVEYDKDNKDHRPLFINAFLPLWKADIADALVDSFTSDLQD